MKKEPCKICNWPYPGFHVCASTNSPETVRQIERRSYKQGFADSHRANLSMAMKEYHQKRTGDRDERISERYRQGDISLRALAEEFNISKSTALAALRRTGTEANPHGVNVNKNR